MKTKEETDKAKAATAEEGYDSAEDMNILDIRMSNKWV